MTIVSASAATATPLRVPSIPSITRTRSTPQRYTLFLRCSLIAGLSLVGPCRSLTSVAVLLHHEQQLLAKPMRESNRDFCRVSASIARMTQYGFHNKLGYVNCKGVLECCDIGVEG